LIFTDWHRKCVPMYVDGRHEIFLHWTDGELEFSCFVTEGPGA